MSHGLSGMPLQPDERFIVSPASGGDLRKHPGLETVQLMLHRFGYLNIKGKKRKRTDPGAKTLPSVPKLGQGVDETSLALAHFQTFQGLPVNGQLDAVTASRLNMPRCGVPDIQTQGHPAFQP